MKQYIGLNKKTGEWVIADNILVNKRNKKVYLIKDLFKLEKLNFQALAKYEVLPQSVGESVTQDAQGNMIFCGDDVEIEYYNQSQPRVKYKIEAKVYYEEQAKIFFMRSENNKVFMFHGDSQHFISSIKRLKRD